MSIDSEHEQKELSCLRQIVNNMQEVIAIIQNGIIQYCTPGVFLLSGYTEHELKSKKIEYFVHPEDREMVLNHYKKRISGVKTLDKYEFRILKKSGKIIWLEVVPKIIEWNGEFATLNSFINVSERKSIQNKLTTKFKTIFESAGEGILIVNEESRIVEANHTAANVLRYNSPDELIGMNTIKLLPDEEVRQKTPKEVLRQTRDKKFYRIERKYCRKDGSCIPVLVTIKFMENLEQYHVIFSDISELKETESRLKDSEHRLRTMFENMGSGVAVYSAIDNGADFEFIDFNPKAEEITLVKKQDVLGKRLLDCFPNMGKSKFFIALQRVYQTGRPEYVKPFYYKDNTREGWRENRIYRLPSGEIVAIFDDVTSRVNVQKELIAAKEEAEAANKAKSLFLANMSHELRTPLTGIIGTQQVLQETNLNAEQQQYVTMATQSARRLSSLLGDIMDLSKIESGKMKILEKPFDLIEVVNIVEHLFRPTCEQKGIQLDFHIDKHIPRKLIGDSIRLQQILNNLVGNAVKFTSTGKISCKLHSLTSNLSGNTRIFFTVSDTGIGIDENKIGTLFQPFIQADEGYERYYQGAGLGLPIVQQLIDLMGGKISIASEKGIGSKFYFTLSFKIDKNQLSAITESDNSIFQENKNYTILVVEDDIINQKAVKWIIKKNGYKANAVANGQEALEELNRNTYDLVLMDIQMPVMDGVEATKAIRLGKAGEQNRDIPIIALTAYAMQGDKEQFFEAGVSGYLAKPADARQLTNLVQKMMQAS